MAFGVLCAYVEAQRSGRGQVVDAAMIDGATSFLAMALGQRADGCWDDRTGANWLTGGAHFYDTYRTSDGSWIAVGSIEPQFHAVLVERLGLSAAEFAPGLFDGTSEGHRQRVDTVWPRLKARVAAAIGALTREEVEALFSETDACVTPVLTLDEAQRHPHNLSRDTFVQVGGQLQNAPAPRFSRSALSVPRPAAQVGEHTAEILSSIGYTEQDILELTTIGAAWGQL